MKKRVLKTAAFCIIGALTFPNYLNTTYAAEATITDTNLSLKNYYDTFIITALDLTKIIPQNEVENILLNKGDNRIQVTKQENYDLAISKVTDYVNIRKEANEASEVLGKLYANSAATVLGIEGDWIKIESGTVIGYIKSEFLATGEEAKELSKSVGNRTATVTTTTLKVRTEPNVDAIVETMVPIGEKLDVIEEIDGWVKVTIDSDLIGYVSIDYVDVITEYKEAESIEEENIRIALEQEKVLAQERALERERALEQERALAQERASAQERALTNQNTERNANKTEETQPSKAKIASPSTTSSKRTAIVNYAVQFVGNPYVWGGTSLTQGADCSGFTQSVFRDNNISISRTSRTQATGGKEVTVDSMQPGDLIFYDSNGVIGHVAIYMGNGKVIGASSEETGIKITNYNYRNPYKVVSYID